MALSHPRRDRFMVIRSGVLGIIEVLPAASGRKVSAGGGESLGTYSNA